METSWVIWAALGSLRGLCKRGKKIKGKLGDVTMEAEAGGMRRGAMSQGMQVASSSWKRPGNGFSLELLEGTQPCRPFYTFGPRNSKKLNVCCFKPLQFVAIS